MLKIIHAIILAIILQSTMVFSFDLTDEGIDKAIREYLSLQMNNIDESVVDEFTKLVRDNLDVFSYIVEAQTDLTVLPYLEKYNALKIRYTGQPINPDIKVILSNNPMKNTPHDESIIFAGFCDYFTRTVFLDRGLWNFYKDNEHIREAVLYHELGHCDLVRSHGDSQDIRKPYFSYMNSDLLEKLLIPNFFELMLRSDYLEYGEEYRRCSKEVEEGYIRGDYDYESLNCDVELELYHYEYLLNSDLDRAFEALNKELFSIQNTADGIEGTKCIGGECTNIYTYQRFEPLFLPMIKHVTIDPTITPTTQDFYEDYHQSSF